MRPVRPRYLVVERAVSRLLAESAVKTPPVPVEHIIRGRGIKLMFPNLGPEVSGVLVRRPGETVIGVNRRHAKTRQRFSMAHELGHALLHEGDEVHHDFGFRINLRSPLSSQGIDPEEVEANHFAACLLMPREFLERDPGAFLVDAEDEKTVAPLAKQYGVSSMAMGYRLATVANRRK